MNHKIKEVLISKEDITKKCQELGNQIDEKYKDYQNAPLFVALLKGSIPFIAELVKYIEMEIEIDFMDVSSYEGTTSTGNIKILKDLDRSIVDQDIVLVEDIVDTGNTLNNVIDLLYNKGAKSITVVSLLDKPSRRVVEVDVEFVGFKIPDLFVVGFGLDYNQKFRNLPYIGVLKEEYYI